MEEGPKYALVTIWSLKRAFFVVSRDYLTEAHSIFDELGVNIGSPITGFWVEWLVMKKERLTL